MRQNKKLLKKISRSIMYAAAPGAIYSHDQAALIVAELERAQQMGVSLTPENIVEMARPADSALHPFFEWDDTKAAEAYRRQQARQMVNHLRIVVSDNSGPSSPVKAYFSVAQEGVSDDDESVKYREYTSVSRVMNDPLAMEQLRQDALREVRSWADKWRSLIPDFTELYNTIDGFGK